MKPFSPCKDCQERTLGCHGICEKYQKFQKDLDKYKERERASRDTFHISEYSIKKTRRELRLRNR